MSGSIGTSGRRIADPVAVAITVGTANGVPDGAAVASALAIAVSVGDTTCVAAAVDPGRAVAVRVASGDADAVAVPVAPRVAVAEAVAEAPGAGEPGRTTKIAFADHGPACPALSTPRTRHV